MASWQALTPCSAPHIENSLCKLPTLCLPLCDMTTHKASKGPEIVKCGSVSVKIYSRERRVDGKPYRVFEVADYTGGPRKMRSFSDHAKARSCAQDNPAGPAPITAITQRLSPPFPPIPRPPRRGARLTARRSGWPRWTRSGGGVTGSSSARTRRRAPQEAGGGALFSRGEGAAGEARLGGVGVLLGRRLGRGGSGWGAPSGALKNPVRATGFDL